VLIAPAVDFTQALMWERFSPEIRRQIEAETHRALVQIRTEVAELTIVAAAKVTGKVLDDTDHRRLIEDAIKELDFSAFEEQEAIR